MASKAPYFCGRACLKNAPNYPLRSYAMKATATTIKAKQSQELFVSKCTERVNVYPNEGQ